MPKHSMHVISYKEGGSITAPEECSTVYLEAGKIRLAVHYDPNKKCMSIRSTTGHPVALIPESNNSFHVRSL